MMDFARQTRLTAAVTLTAVAIALGVASPSSAIARAGLARPDVVALIANAESAGPDGISKAATILDWPVKAGEPMTVLRKGTNGWTCLPDQPGTPFNDPMCMDEVWMEWMHAGMDGREARIDRIGVAYMLQGGWAADQADSFRHTPPAGKAPYLVGPHVMFIAPNASELSGLSRDPQSGGPFLESLERKHPIILMPVAAAGTTLQVIPQAKGSTVKNR